MILRRSFCSHSNKNCKEIGEIKIKLAEDVAAVRGKNMDDFIALSKVVLDSNIALTSDSRRNSQIVYGAMIAAIFTGFFSVTSLYLKLSSDIEKSSIKLETHLKENSIKLERHLKEDMSKQLASFLNKTENKK